MIALPGVLGLAASLGARELVLMNGWMSNKRGYYDLAEAAAKARRKPLLVVGRPRGRDHGVGDVCIDLNGCPECPEKGVRGDVRDMSMFPDKTFGAVFVGSVLESISSDFDKAVREIHRVGDEVFVQHIFDSSLSSRFHPETSTTIHAAPPTVPWVEYTHHADGIRRVVFQNGHGLAGIKLMDVYNEAVKVAAAECRAKGAPIEKAANAVTKTILELAGIVS